MGGLKFDKDASYGEKLPWHLTPFEAIEGMIRVLQYGKRKYTICGDCKAPVYPNPHLDGDPERGDCPECGSKNIKTGAHNWREGFDWTRVIDSAYRHLKAFTYGEDIDEGPQGSGLPHIDHLMCCVAFLSAHQKNSYGRDDRYCVQSNNCVQDNDSEETE